MPERQTIGSGTPIGRYNLIEQRLYCLGIEDDHLLKALVRQMLDAGVESVVSHDFHPEPTDATKMIEEGIQASLSRDEINRKPRSLREVFDNGETARRVTTALAESRHFTGPAGHQRYGRVKGRRTRPEGTLEFCGKLIAPFDCPLIIYRRE